MGETTVSITGSTTSWINNLTNPGLKSEFSSLITSGSLSYSGAVQLLDYVASQGSLTASEFSDLQTIVSNLNVGLSTSSYVDSVLAQLIDGSSANATWTGGGASSVALGNLQVGSAPTQLNELIGKWLLGTDMPNPDIPASSGQAAVVATYAAFSLPLFGASGAPSVSDVNQGTVGDCDLCAGMVDMAINHPVLLESMIVDDGNGIYGVRFDVNGNATWVTVNNELPVNASGQLVYNNAFASNGTLWADLIEKAYAELSATGEIGHPPINSYNNIYTDPTVQVFENLAGATSVVSYQASDPSWNSYKQFFINALASGDDLILESYGNTTDSSGKSELVSNHAFAIVGYDSSTGDFIVRNPWGTEAPQFIVTYDTQFEVSMSDISGVAGAVVVDNSAGSSINFSSVSQNQSNSFFSLPNGVNVPIYTLFSVTDIANQSITKYMLQTSIGAIQLNGATNLASAAQISQGEIVVSAADLSKLLYSNASATGDGTLEVYAYDGAWSPVQSIGLQSTTAPIAVIPKINSIVAPGGTISVASLFSTVGASVSLTTGDYQVVPINNQGTITVPSSASYTVSSGSPGQVDFFASGLPLASYIAPDAPGQYELYLWAYTGTAWSDQTIISLYVGDTVNDSIKNFDSGQYSLVSAVVDSASNIFSNLDALESIFSSGYLVGVNTSDSSLKAETISGAQFDSDKGVLGIISGNYSLTITNMLAADASSLSSNYLATYVASLTVTDSAADVAGNLDALQALTAAGKLTSIALTDGGAPVLSVTAAQLAGDVGALHDISSPYSLSISAAAPNVTITGLTAQDTVVFSGTASEYAIAPVGTGPAFTVTDTGTGRASIDHVSNIEFLQFADQLMFVTTPAEAQIALLYQGALGRTPDIPGLTGWQGIFNAMPPLPANSQIGVYELSDISGGYGGGLSIAAGFTNSTEFMAKYGSLTDTQFVTQLYSNILDRAPDAPGFNGWMSQLASGTTREHVLVGFADSPEAYINAEMGFTGQSGYHAPWLVVV